MTKKELLSLNVEELMRLLRNADCDVAIIHRDGTFMFFTKELEIKYMKLAQAKEVKIK